jgi:hypothetical protein
LGENYRVGYETKIENGVNEGDVDVPKNANWFRDGHDEWSAQIESQ